MPTCTSPSPSPPETPRCSRSEDLELGPRRCDDQGPRGPGQPLPPAQASGGPIVGLRPEVAEGVNWRSRTSPRMGGPHQDVPLCGPRPGRNEARVRTRYPCRGGIRSAHPGPQLKAERGRSFAWPRKRQARPRPVYQVQRAGRRSRRPPMSSSRASHVGRECSSGTGRAPGQSRGRAYLPALALCRGPILAFPSCSSSEGGTRRGHFIGEMLDGDRLGPEDRSANASVVHAALEGGRPKGL
jgi:hypothetical protein